MRALITVNNICYFQRMLELARQLQQHGKFGVCLYLHGFVQFEARHREICREAGIEVVGSSDPKWFARLWRVAALGEAASTVRLIRMIRAEIRRHDIDIVVMPEDSPDYGGPAITAAARAEHVPTAVLASLGSIPLVELANIYMYIEPLVRHGLSQRVAAFLFPSWSHRHRGQSILRSPAERVFIQELLRIAADKPWLYYSGHADAILVESEEVRSFCVEHGLDESRVRVTGFVEQDLLFAGLQHARTLRAELDAELGLDPHKRILLLALVQSHYIGGAPRCDFQHYPDMVEFIVKTAAATSSFNVVVCLHPSMKVDDYRYIEDWGVRISQRETVKLVPLCDVYVASGSSTISWAVACGKPVINYDVYRYELSAYSKTPGVVTVQEQADFAAQIARVDDAGELSHLTARQAASAARWGKPDGRSFERIVATLEELVG